MKEVGMEDCSPNIMDDDTTTTTNRTTSAMSSYSFSSGFDSSEDSSASLNDNYFPIMQLPVEIRCKIFNMLIQRQVPLLRLVCRQWKYELDQFYEFSLNIYDTTTNFNLIKDLRCRECVIWKLTAKIFTPSLFLHPAYLKSIRVYGPASAENLANLITVSTNLEHLTLTRRANYPWFLNLQDTPALANLTELKFLRLNSEEHVTIHLKKDAVPLQCPPLMDCYFPKLKHFEILKRFAMWQYSHYVSSILKFVARHSKTLKNIELDLIPLSCIARLDPHDSSDSDSDDELDKQQNKRRISFIPPEIIQLQDLCNLNLHKFCVTTKGADRDIFIWKSILEKQTSLKELRFDWLCRDPKAEIRARLTGFPWIHFQTPVEQSSAFLVHVELASLSMFGGGNRVVPFDLAIFRNCISLKSLILRCRENHAKLGPDELAQVDPEDAAEGGVLEAIGGEVLLMTNGSDLPDSLEQLEIFRFPMLTSGITGMVSKIQNIRKFFLHECGKTGNFGVSADVIKEMASLKSLKFLEVIGFNDSNGERRSELEQVFQSIGIPYEGQDTWLEFSDGSTSAHELLKVLL